MKGVKPEWENLPRRKCDYCGTSYKPKQPLRRKRGFCKISCRNAYHRHGGAYTKLRDLTRKMVDKEIAELRRELQAIYQGKSRGDTRTQFICSSCGCVFQLHNYEGTAYRKDGTLAFCHCTGKQTLELT